MLAQTAADIPCRPRAARRAERRVEARRRPHPGASPRTTRCASSRATSPTSPIACRRSSLRSARFDAPRIVLDGEAIALRDDGRPEPFQVTMSRFGTKAASRPEVDAAVGVLLRLPACRRRGPDRRARTRAASPRSTHGFPKSTSCRASRRTMPRRPGVPRRRSRPRPRGRDGQVARRAVRGRATRRRLAEGQAVAHARPRRARGRVGPRPPQGKLSNLHLGARDPETAGTSCSARPSRA